MLLAALVPIGQATAAPTPLTIVVAPDGIDTAAGTADHPLRTLEAARDAVRDLGPARGRGVQVLLRGGTYTVDETLTFDARDSGSARHPVTWSAYPGETPVIDGGSQIDGWAVHDAGAGIWSAPADGVIARQLYVEGRQATRARTTAFTGTTSTDNTGHLTTDITPLTWQRPESVELVYRQIWTQPRNLVTSVSQASDGRTRVTMAQPAWGYNRRKGGTSTTSPPVWIENDYTFLDEPGEWYLDPDVDTVYYIPRDGEDLTTADVVIPTTERLLTIHGTADEPVHDLVFDGLTFAHSTWLQPSGSLGGHPDVQANLVRLPEPGMDNKVAPTLVTPGAVHLEYAHRITISDSEFTRLGNAGVDIARGSREVTVTRNRIHDIAGSGVQVGEVDISDGSLTYDPAEPYNTANYDPDDPRDIIRGIDVIDNAIARIGLDYASAVGVFVGYTQDVSIAHNDLVDLPYSGISLGWGWGQPQILANTIAQDNTIVGNTIRDAMTTLRDGGAIYTLGGQAGTIIDGNLTDDVVLSVYLDQGSSGMTVSDNVSIDSAALLIQADFGNQVYATGAFDNTIARTYWRGSSGPAANGVVSRENGDNTLTDNVRVSAGADWPVAADQVAAAAGISSAAWNVGDPYAAFDVSSVVGAAQADDTAPVRLTATVGRAANIDPQANVRWAFDGGPALAHRTFTVTGAGQFTTNASGVGYFGTATRFGSRVDLHGVNGQALSISGTLPAGDHDLRLGLVDTASPATPLLWSAPHQVSVVPEVDILTEDFDDIPLDALPSGWTTSGGAGTATVVTDPDGTGRSLRIDHPAVSSSSFLTQVPFGAQTGQVTVRLRFRAEQTTAYGYGPWLRDAAGTHGPTVAAKDDGTFGVYRTNAWTSIGAYESGRWYDLELRIDVPTNRYAVAVDGVSVASDVPFRSAVDDLALLQFGAFSGDVGTFHVDDIRLSHPETGA